LNKVPDPAGQPLGAVDGEILGVVISDCEIRTGKSVWNNDLPGAVAAIDRHAGELPVVDLLGDCRLSLLSPDLDRLLELKDHWRAELKRAGVASGDRESLRRLLESSETLRPLGDVLGDSDSPPADRYELPDSEGRDLRTPLDDALGGAEDGEAGANAPFGADDSTTNGSSIAFPSTTRKTSPPRGCS